MICPRCHQPVAWGAGALVYEKPGGYLRRVVLGDSREKRQAVHEACIAYEVEAGALVPVSMRVFEPAAVNP